MVVVKADHVVPKFELVTHEDLPKSRILKKSSSEVYGRTARTGWVVAYDPEHAAHIKEITSLNSRTMDYHIPKKKQLPPATLAAYKPEASSRKDPGGRVYNYDHKRDNAILSQRILNLKQ